MPYVVESGRVNDQETIEALYLLNLVEDIDLICELLDSHRELDSGVCWIDELKRRLEVQSANHPPERIERVRQVLDDLQKEIDAYWEERYGLDEAISSAEEFDVISPEREYFDPHY